MRIELTQQETIWLAELTEKEKHRAITVHDETPHPLLELRRDNMATLEEKLRSAVKRHNDKIRRDAR